MQSVLLNANILQIREKVALTKVLLDFWISVDNNVTYVEFSPKLDMHRLRTKTHSRSYFFFCIYLQIYFVTISPHPLE